MSSYEIMRNDYIGEFDTATMSYVKYEDRVTERDVVGMPDSDDSDWEDWIRERRDKIYRRDNAKVNLAEKAKRQVFIDQMKADGTLRGHLETLVTSSALMTPPDSSEKP